MAFCCGAAGLADGLDGEGSSATLSVVIGASRGVGLALVRQLKERDHSVLAVVRNATPDLKALDVEILDGVDMEKPESFSKVAEAIGRRRVNMFIQNAGLLTLEGLGEDNPMDPEKIARQFQVNATAPVCMVFTCQSKLKGAKIILLGTSVGSITKHEGMGSINLYGYRMSKCALHMGGRSLAEDLKGKANVAIVHPGMVETGMTAGFNLKAGGDSPWGPVVDVDQSAKGILKIADGLNTKNTGTLWHSQTGEVIPW